MIKTEIALYLEINLLFVFIVAVLIYSVRQNSSGTLLDRFLTVILVLVAAIVATDGFTRVSDGNPFPGSLAISVVCNTIGFAAGAAASLMWALYVDYKCYADNERLRRRLPILMLSALIQIGMAILSQPFHLIFYVDSDCVYHRGSFFWVQAVVESVYLLYAMVVAFRHAGIEPMKARKNECIMLAVFGFFPLAGGFTQMLFYGLPTLWPMTICALMLVVQHLQKSQIYTDALTGLNNRGRFDQYLAAQVKEFDPYVNVYVILMDVDDFKGVNDNFGHNIGDAALVSVAGCLRRATAKGGEFVARYGGDEFAIVCRCRSDEGVRALEKEIRRQFRCYNDARQPEQPVLGISIGYAAMRRGEEDSVELVLREADARMYEEKKRRHKLHG